MHFTDPLLFACELHEVVLLQVVLPTGDVEYISIGDTAADVALPAGFTAVSLDILQLNSSTRNIFLTLSIANASLLDGGEIRCYDSTRKKAVMAGCRIDCKLTNILNFSDESKCNHPTCFFYKRPHHDT